MHESEKWKWSRSVVSYSSDPMDCSLPGSSVHGIFQARVLERGAIAFSEKREYSDRKNKEHFFRLPEVAEWPNKMRKKKAQSERRQAGLWETGEQTFQRRDCRVNQHREGMLSTYFSIVSYIHWINIYLMNTVPATVLSIGDRTMRSVSSWKMHCNPLSKWYNVR